MLISCLDVLAELTAYRQHGDGLRVQHLSSVDEMPMILEAVLGEMEEMGYSTKDLFGIRLALEEAICNAIKHGHRHDLSKVVQVRWWASPEHLLVEVEDEGPGFDLSGVADSTAPENLQRPCGRGLLLIRYYATWVRHNRQGNCITFCIAPSGSVRRPVQQRAHATNP